MRVLELTVPPAQRNTCQEAQAQRWTLVAAILGSSLAFLDSTVVNVALPVMQRDLGASTAAVQWIVESYALMLSSLVLVGGALGDRWGRKRVFAAGVVLFAAASATCAASPGSTFLVFARGVQGVGAALLVPGSLSLISAAFSEKDRGAAIGTWSAFSAVTSAVGPIAGGWVVGHASWRWLFLFNLPVAAAVLTITFRHVRETRDETAPQRMDWLGATLAACGLGVVVFALIGTGGPVHAGAMLAELGAGAALLGAFLWVQARKTSPMVPLSLFRSRPFSGANVLTFLLYGAFGGALFFLPFNLIQVRHASPTEAGAALVPLVVLISAMSRWSGKRAAHGAARTLLIAGPMLTGAGFVLLAVCTAGTSYWTAFFPGIVAMGVGMGLTVAPLTATVMGAVSPNHLGIASGVNNAVARAAGLLAVAGLGLVLIAQFDHRLDARLAHLGLEPQAAQVVAAQRSKLGAANLSAVRDPAARRAAGEAIDAAYLSGFRALMWVCAVLAWLSALAAWRSLGSPEPS